MIKMPEFPLERLTKEELLTLIGEIKALTFFNLTDTKLKELAWSVREKTLADEFRKASEAAKIAYDAYCDVPDKQRVRRAEAHLAHVRASEKDHKTFERWNKFSRAFRDAVKGGAS